MSFEKFARVAATIQAGLIKTARDDWGSAPTAPVTKSTVVPASSPVSNKAPSSTIPKSGLEDFRQVSQEAGNARRGGLTKSQIAPTPRNAGDPSKIQAAKPVQKFAPVWDKKMTEFVNKRNALEQSGLRRGSAEWDANQKALNQYYAQLLRGGKSAPAGRPAATPATAVAQKQIPQAPAATAPTAPAVAQNAQTPAPRAATPAPAASAAPTAPAVQPQNATAAFMQQNTQNNAAQVAASNAQRVANQTAAGKYKLGPDGKPLGLNRWYSPQGVAQIEEAIAANKAPAAPGTAVAKNP